MRGTGEDVNKSQVHRVLPHPQLLLRSLIITSTQFVTRKASSARAINSCDESASLRRQR